MTRIDFRWLAVCVGLVFVPFSIASASQDTAVGDAYTCYSIYVADMADASVSGDSAEQSDEANENQTEIVVNVSFWQDQISALPPQDDEIRRTYLAREMMGRITLRQEQGEAFLEERQAPRRERCEYLRSVAVAAPDSVQQDLPEKPE